MKKIYLVLLLSLFIIVGCEEEVKNITLTGRKYINETEYEEIIYEWLPEEPNKILRKTYVYTIINGTDSQYNIKLIDCDSFKRKGSLYSCKVTKEKGNVIYKEIYSKDEEGTKEKFTEELKKQGYKIIE